jgi:predicted Ser/Thr protein kinase
MTVQDRTPDKFGPYRVLERIGEGGMGVVYLAADAEERPVAVKVLRSAVAGDPDARRRLAREVETMRRVRSPFVAAVIDADVACEPPYIVTRYVRGRTLDQVVSEHGPLRGPELAMVARGVASALTAVHAAGVVHRDLKPGNIMLSDGEPVVIDFGIAHSPDSTRITQTGMFMGTPGYLAPEVIEGKVSGQASDVHSWGATVAFAATGRPPFGTGSFETIFYRIINGQPDLDGCPQPLLPLVAAALARDPARRPLAAELNEWAAALTPAALVAGPVLAGAAGAAGAVPGVSQAAGPAAGVPRTMAEWAGLGGPAGAAGGPLAAAAVAAQGAGLATAQPATVRPGNPLPGSPLPGGAPPGSAGPAPGTAWPHVTQPLAVGNPAGPYVGDLLPAVQYGAPGAGPGGAHPAGNGLATSANGRAAGTGADGRPAGRRRSRLVFVVASVAVCVGASVILPIVGTLAALALLLSLRAADLSQRRLARRRAARGTRAFDPAVTAAAYPVMLAWSAVTSLLLAPVALVAAGVAAGVTIVAVPLHPFPRALAYAAGALVACYGLGPGSGGSRRQFGKLFDAVGGSRSAAVVALIGISALAMAAIAAAASQLPVYWPLHHLGTPSGNLHALRIAVQHARTAVIQLAGRVVR